MIMNTQPHWLLLIVSLPTPSATARMRVWRGLKGLACMALRDGALLAVATAGVLWRFKKVTEPVIVVVAALVGLVAHPLLSHG